MEPCPRWFYTHPNMSIPLSETREEMKNGVKNLRCRKIKHKQPSRTLSDADAFKDPRKEEKRLQDEIHMKFIMTSTYRRHYYAQAPSLCPPQKPVEDDLDPLFNRRPVNNFQMRPGSTKKFMDDSLCHPSEQRQRINFLRQIRNVSYLKQMMKN